MLLISRLKLISPRLSVTGSISSSTRRTFESRIARRTRTARQGTSQAERRVAQIEGRHRQLDHGPDEHADRVGVDLLVVGNAGASPTRTAMIATFQKKGEIANTPKRS